ncbi:GSK3-beta interaction protein [Bradysia coprophila]|uniref:GSK3-beta interaction protein n=1 Tax=Bradysia coprophila TaxID=38358 RepID=UPI00187D918C|nr:GSK3-beta interaction protein [Bradysia coprophila]
MSSNLPHFDTASDSPEPLLEWQDEAAAIIKDVENHVKHIQISSKLQSSKTEIFLNLTTLEEATFCIRISTEGFQIVGQLYDTIGSNDNTAVTYETPYALLNSVSERYVQSFGNGLTAALEKLISNE